MTQAQSLFKRTRIFAPLCLALTQSVVTPTAWAQEGTGFAHHETATTLDQVTVTARQRSERLQDVPIAVTAFNTADIRNAGISRPGDFIALTANVNLEEAQNAGTSFITIRGIAQVRNSEQPVAVVVDGVPQISPNQFNQELFDIAQIEVLKGPQGALYGNNSIGGAINITTVAPGETPSGYAQIGTGNGGLKRVQGSFGAPLSRDGRWRGQVSGYWSDFDGLIKNQYLNEMVNDVRSRGVRLRLLGQIGEDIHLDVQASDGHDTGGALNHVYQPLYGVSDAGNAGLPITANNHGINERRNSQAAFKLDWNRPWGNLTSITAWSRMGEYYAADQFPYSPATTVNPELTPNPNLIGLGDGTQSVYLYVHGISQELRLTSHSDQRWRWIAGIYAQSVDRYRASTIGQDLGRGIIPVLRAPNPANSDNPSNTFLADDNANDTYAVFGQLAYDVTSQLEAALAMRYDYAEREQTDVAPEQFSATSGQVRRARFKAFQPKATISWKPRQNFTGFASLGRGFNSGGFNQNGTGARAEEAGLGGVSDLYGQETANSYEFGIKTRPVQWLDVNASAFYTELNNQHYFGFVGAVGAQVIAPIDKTRLQGIELEAKLIPIQPLVLFASYGYTDSEIRKNSVNPAAVGNRSPYVPRSTINLGVQYTAEFGDALDAVLRVDYRRLGEQYWDTLNSTARPALNLLDARVIMQSTNGLWSLTFWGRNLTDKIYNTDWVAGGFAHPSQPRTYGADLRFNF